MIVDDHEEIRTSIARLARGWGHEVAVAADGSSALSLAEAFQPECAIVDISMPGMNGIELARRLRQRFPPAQLCLIALTGYAGDGHPRRVPRRRFRCVSGQARRYPRVGATARRRPRRILCVAAARRATHLRRLSDRQPWSPAGARPQIAEYKQHRGTLGFEGGVLR